MVVFGATMRFLMPKRIVGVGTPHGKTAWWQGPARASSGTPGSAVVFGNFIDGVRLRQSFGQKTGRR